MMKSFFYGALLWGGAVMGQGPVRQVRLSRFTLQSSAVVKAGGEVVSTEGYRSKDYWFPVRVPCTVLTGLVANKVYPDPYTGMNNMLIPDASDSFNHEYHLEQYSHMPGEPNPWKKPYWYRTVFAVPAADKGRHFQLIFKGINYRAEVWVNGKLIADSARMVGMFEESDLDASAAIRAGEENVLAVKIYPLDEPGLPSTPQLKALEDFYDNGGPTGDIGKNVTMLSSVGWDWIPEVRDRNMGIWQPVYLRTTGPVVISKMQIITDLPSLPDTGVAKISLNFLLSNNSDRERRGRVTITIRPENFTGTAIMFGRDAVVGASESKTIHLSADEIPALLIHHPRLWWPNGYGNPDLYRVRIQYTAADRAGGGTADGSGLSDDTSFVFGIRTVSSSAVEVNGWVRRDFFVNGRRVHLNGGAWVPDMMLNRDYQRYDYELRLCRNANVNLVRVWGGGLGETDDFYELADRYGLLVWQDFWITGDTNGGFKGSADWPLQTNVFVNNVVSTIERIRNHPSLLVWTGGNEGHAREELYNAMRDNVANLDGTRPFIPCSSGFSKAPKSWKGSWPDDRPAGVYSGGPYSWQDDAQYYRLVDAGKDWVFKDETGLPSQPPYNTLAKIIPNLVPGLHYEAEVVGVNGATLYRQEGHAGLDMTDVKEVLSLRDVLRKTTGISFVLLGLKDASGRLLSQNVYWMSPGHDFTALRSMPAAQVEVKVLARVVKGGYVNRTLQFTNVSKRLAFFLNPQLIKDGEEVLPSFWSDNYFSLPVGKVVTVTVSCPAAMWGGTLPQLRLEGWNIMSKTINI